jgi:dynein heavy chain
VGWLGADCLLRGLHNLVVEHLDARYTENPAWDLAGFYKDSSVTTPLIFILSAGADPMSDLLTLADALRFSKRFEKVSLGQGQVLLPATPKALV